MDQQNAPRCSRHAAEMGSFMALLLGLGSLACEGNHGAERMQGSRQATAEIRRDEETMPSKSIEQVQEEHTPALMRIEGVVGTYLGQTDAGQPCIKVMVREQTSDLARQIPSELGGYPVEVVVSGEIRPLPQERQP